jgi:hypothetical protein
MHLSKKCNTYILVKKEGILAYLHLLMLYTNAIEENGELINFILPLNVLTCDML